MKKVAATVLFALAGILALAEFFMLIGDPHVPWYQHSAFILVTR